MPGGSVDDFCDLCLVVLRLVLMACPMRMQMVKQMMKEEKEPFALRLMDPCAFRLFARGFSRERVAKLMFSY